MEFDMACYIQAIPYLKDGPIKKFLVQMMIDHYLNPNEEYRLMERISHRFDGHETGIMGAVTVTTPATYFEEHEQEIVGFLKKMEEE
jgi:hypothetical protein